MGLDSAFVARCFKMTIESSPKETHPQSEKNSNFFLGFLFLSPLQRQALSAVYAYCRMIDDLVDDAGKTEKEARQGLDFWREEVERIFSGQGTLPLSREIEKTLNHFPLPKEAFFEMIRGCEMDLNKTHYQTFSDLEPYLKGVAVSVGQMSVEIFGHKHTPPEKMREFVDSFGYAFQMTNILRDVGDDLSLGRIYIPESEMEKAGYSREKLLKREHNAAFRLLMQGLWQKTKGFYRQGRNALDFRDRATLMPAEIMAHVYEGILDEIRQRDFHVFFSKTKISPFKKLRLAFKAWLYCHGF